MNKAELIDASAAIANVSKAETGKVLDAILKCITNTLASGEQVALVGFGSWIPKVRAARTGRNPKTGEVLAIAEAMVVLFKAGKLLKDSVNSKNLVVEHAEV